MTVVSEPTARRGRVGTPLSPGLVRFGAETADTALEVVCFPAAGEPATRFAAWPGELPETVGLLVAERSGRGRRIAEAPSPRLSVVADEAAAEVEAHCTRPVILLGHSAGTLVAHAVASRLERRGRVRVLGVVAAHGRSPVIDRFIKETTMDDAELAAEVIEGHPALAPLFARPDFAALFAAAIRADLLLYERTPDEWAPPIAGPVIAVGGREDTIVNMPDIWRWREATTGLFVGATVAGGHFAPVEEPDRFLAELWPLVDHYFLGGRP